MKKKMKFWQILLLLAVIAAMVAVIAVRVTGNHSNESVVPDHESSSEPTAIKHTDGIIQEVQTIDVQTIEDGLQDMGILVTAEYYFSDIITYSESLNLKSFKIPFTESSFMAGYDGVVTAGINFTDITVSVDDETKKVTVEIPKAVIQNVDIDPSSFVLYSEKSGIGTSVSLSDYNSSMVELENKAKSNAEAKGLLTDADKNARVLIYNFVEGLLTDNEYTVVILEK